MPGLLYADEFVLCGESEEDLKVMRSFMEEGAECHRKVVSE